MRSASWSYCILSGAEKLAYQATAWLPAAAQGEITIGHTHLGRVLTKDRLENCGFCGEGVEIVLEVVVDPQRQFHHFHGLGDHLRAATEPRKKMTNVAVVHL